MHFLLDNFSIYFCMRNTDSQENVKIFRFYPWALLNSILNTLHLSFIWEKFGRNWIITSLQCNIPSSGPHPNQGDHSLQLNTFTRSSPRFMVFPPEKSGNLDLFRKFLKTFPHFEFRWGKKLRFFSLILEFFGPDLGKKIF